MLPEEQVPPENDYTPDVIQWGHDLILRPAAQTFNVPEGVEFYGGEFGYQQCKSCPQTASIFEIAKKIFGITPEEFGPEGFCGRNSSLDPRVVPEKLRQEFATNIQWLYYYPQTACTRLREALFMLTIALRFADKTEPSEETTIDHEVSLDSTSRILCIDLSRINTPRKLRQRINDLCKTWESRLLLVWTHRRNITPESLREYREKINSFAHPDHRLRDFPGSGRYTPDDNSDIDPTGPCPLTPKYDRGISHVPSSG